MVVTPVKPVVSTTRPTSCTVMAKSLTLVKVETSVCPPLAAKVRRPLVTVRLLAPVATRMVLSPAEPMTSLTQALPMMKVFARPALPSMLTRP